MNCYQAQEHLDDYLDGELNDDDRLLVELHLEGCSTCSQELDASKVLVGKVSLLPRLIPPTRDLWPGVLAAIRQGVGPTNVFPLAGIERRRGRRLFAAARRRGQSVRRSRWHMHPIAIAASVLVVITSLWLFLHPSDTSWGVARLEGLPHIGGEPVGSRGDLQVGDWLETDEFSKARVEVGMIGQLDVEPNTRLRLVKSAVTDHRLSLDHGTIHAAIWAPPRLFFVETPSALVIDLGCSYTLHVDHRGAGFLEVTSGFVALKKGETEAIVPAGTLCRTMPGIGPGTPYHKTASELLRDALARFDFEGGGSIALTRVLAEARQNDAITLWHLLSRVDQIERGRVYDRLALLIPPPSHVVKEEILAGNREMLFTWAKELGISSTWWEM